MITVQMTEEEHAEYIKLTEINNVKKALQDIGSQIANLESSIAKQKTFITNKGKDVYTFAQLNATPVEELINILQNAQDFKLEHTYGGRFLITPKNVVSVASVKKFKALDEAQLLKLKGDQQKLIDFKKSLEV